MPRHQCSAPNFLPSFSRWPSAERPRRVGRLARVARLAMRLPAIQRARALVGHTNSRSTAVRDARSAPLPLLASEACGTGAKRNLPNATTRSSELSVCSARKRCTSCRAVHASLAYLVLIVCLGEGDVKQRARRLAAVGQPTVAHAIIEQQRGARLRQQYHRGSFVLIVPCAFTPNVDKV